MNIGVLIDSEAVDADDPQFEKADSKEKGEVEWQVTRTLRELGHGARVIPLGDSVRGLLDALDAEKPELIFNLTEHFRGDRHKDMNIAAVLDLTGIPYTGSGPAGLLLCRDKATCKRILIHHKIKVPNFIIWPPGKTRIAVPLRYPVIVKPLMEDGSDGISLLSLVRNEVELRERVRVIHERYHGPAICEEFIEGRELYVGVLGNGRLTVLPPREIRFGKTDEGGPIIATSRVKMDEEYRKKWEITFGHAELDRKLREQINHTAKRVFHLLCIRDYGRVDLRITPAGDLYVLEANPNPDLTADDELALAAAKAGMEYRVLISSLLHFAKKRA